MELVRIVLEYGNKCVLWRVVMVTTVDVEVFGLELRGVGCEKFGHAAVIGLGENHLSLIYYYVYEIL